jgi:chorismate-pyruvate lyase
MTVTVERFHRSPVDVKVLDVGQTKTHYSRKILLTRQSDGRVVQFGLVRLCLHFLEPQVQREITDRQTPLGRVLIKHNVLRQVQLISLFKVTPGPDLQQMFGLADAEPTYGRTALIYCNGVPAVELLEIVTPAG